MKCSASDYLSALDVLAKPGCASELRAFACAAYKPDLALNLPRVCELVKAPVATLLEAAMVNPPDFKKEMWAWHLWNTCAHDELNDANKVRQILVSNHLARCVTILH